jgi:hypothetical protein
MDCKHEKKTNLAVSRHAIRHEYCQSCGWHLYNGVEYTKSEWYDKYIRDDEQGDSHDRRKNQGRV